MNEMVEIPVAVPAAVPVAAPVGFMSPVNLLEALELAKVLCASDFVPKDYQRKPENAVVAMQMGAEVGLGPVQSLQTIAVINGKPTIYGDGLLALAQGSALCELIEEGWEDATQSAWCRVKRRGQNERTVFFSMDDAKLAKLSGKPGPWSQYPRRMCQMRARSWALRDTFADVLKGLSKIGLADEIMVKDVGRSSGGNGRGRLDRQRKEMMDKATGEIIDIKPEGVPELPEEVLMAVAEIRDQIRKAGTVEALRALKEEIKELPEVVQGDLIGSWNERRKDVKLKEVG